MSKINALVLPKLKELAAQGLNSQALLLLQQRVMVSVTRANPDLAASEKVAQADSLLPKGSKIYDAYSQALVSINKQEIEQMEQIATHLQWLEGHLERQYAKAIAQEEPLAQFAEQQGAIAEVYAGVLKHAYDLQNRGVIAVSNSPTLTSLVDRNDGPLQEIYQKALLLVEGDEATHERQRAAA